MKLTRNSGRAALAFAGALSLVFAMNMGAQVQTEKSTASGPGTHDVTVETATVVLVNGNDLLVKLPDGTMRHFPNVPESARVTVGSQKLGIHDLKPGMTITRTIVKTTTPQMITTVQSVTGTVWFVNPPLSVILRMDDNTNQSFKIPNGQKFNVDGQMVDAWGLKKGMKISATKVVEVPQTLVSQKTLLTGTLPPPPPPDQPILVAVVVPLPPPPAPAAAPAPAPEAPAPLPKTGSELPLIGLVGLACLGGSFGLKLLRR